MLSNQKLTINLHNSIEFGTGAIDRLPGIVTGMNARRVFIVTDRGVRAAGVLDTVSEVLAAGNIEVGVFDAVEPNPTSTTVDTAAAQLREFGESIVVPVGGGSSMDTAKGVSLVAVNGGTAADFDYRNVPDRPGMPLIAVPTTAGTGAETNAFGVIEDTVRRRKFYVGHSSVHPVAAVLDPALTVGLPPGPTAATGMDALTHALESLSSINANPFADGLSLQAIRMIHRWLPDAVKDGSDIEARGQLLLASHLAGMAFATTGLGMCHGIAHTLSAHFGTAHGIALSSVLQHVLEFNRPVRQAQYAVVAQAIGVTDPSGNDERSARAAIAAVGLLAEQVGAVRPLHDLGCTADQLPALAEAMLADEVMANTPRMPSADELCTLMAAAL
jgi:alcohol dehydrogenase class IV